MNETNEDALRRLTSPAPGTHAIFWGNGSDGRDEAIAAFLRGGVSRDDVLAVVVPRREFPVWQARMLRYGIDLDGLADAGRALWAGSDDLAPRSPREVRDVGSFLLALANLADTVGRSGVTVVAKYACFFERGEQVMAQLIEGATEAHTGAARILCLYNGRDLPAGRRVDAMELTRLHTEAITAKGPGQLLVVPIASARPRASS